MYTYTNQLSVLKEQINFLLKEFEVDYNYFNRARSVKKYCSEKIIVKIKTKLKVQSKLEHRNRFSQHI